MVIWVVGLVVRVVGVPVRTYGMAVRVVGPMVRVVRPVVLETPLMASQPPHPETSSKPLHILIKFTIKTKRN
jgi:hypothetical protein